MVTGDNILTAISVARDCKLLQPGVTVIKVEAHKVDSQLNVSYTIEDAPETQVNNYNFYKKISNFEKNKTEKLKTRCLVGSNGQACSSGFYFKIV